MGRVVIVLAALLLGLVGLFMSLCGGTVTVMTMRSPGEMGMLLVAVPSVAVGIFLLVVTYRIFRGMRD